MGEKKLAFSGALQVSAIFAVGRNFLKEPFHGALQVSVYFTVGRVFLREPLHEALQVSLAGGNFLRDSRHSKYPWGKKSQHRLRENLVGVIRRGYRIHKIYSNR